MTRGEVYGVRAFPLSREGWLYSPSTGLPLREGVNRAACPRASHRPGALGCGCGFYGSLSPEAEAPGPGEVLTLVAGAGRLTLGEEGFRAEALRLLALVAPAPLERYTFLPTYDRVALALEDFPLGVHLLED